MEGPFVFGAYSHKELGHKEVYFALDTRNGTNLDFTTLAEIPTVYAGHPVRLTETFSFRSSDGRRGLLLAIEALDLVRATSDLQRSLFWISCETASTG